jgi:predicted nucleotidyltransferase
MGRDEVLKVLQEHRREFERFGVVSVSLFGSVARNEASDDSDVDTLAEFERPLTFKRFMGFKFFLEDLLGLSVDLVTERGLRERVRPYVERDAIRVA